MLSTAIIIFREVFEIVLILGAVLAATSDLKGRGKWITGGMLAGLFGSAMVAVFTETISNGFDGLGQEVFNAMVLFAAAAVIGCTVLWMQQHSYKLRAKVKEVGAAIAEGDLPFITLSVIIALAMLREGSEIVLFTYSMILSGQSAWSIGSGAVVGLIGGLAVGGAFYFGLLRMSPKYFFKITSAILMLLVAGMVSQGFGFLVAAGYFENFSKVVWDTSHIISEQGIVGQSLEVLMGYTSRPMQIQLLAYVMTLGGLIGTVKIMDRKHKISMPKAAAAAALVVGVLLLMTNQAAAAVFVF